MAIGPEAYIIAGLASLGSSIIGGQSGKGGDTKFVPSPFFDVGKSPESIALSQPLARLAGLSTRRIPELDTGELISGGSNLPFVLPGMLSNVQKSDLESEFGSLGSLGSDPLTSEMLEYLGLFNPELVPKGDFEALPGEFTFTSPTGFGFGIGQAPRDPFQLDSSFITDVDLKSDMFGDLTPPNQPVLPPSIQAPNIPGADTSFDITKEQSDFLGQLISQISSNAAVRGLETSPEAAAQAISGPLAQFRQTEIALKEQARVNTMNTLTNIYGIEVAQRASDIASSDANYQAQLSRITQLQSKQADLEMAKTKATTERQSLQAALAEAQGRLQLEQEQLTFLAATTLLQATQGTTAII